MTAYLEAVAQAREHRDQATEASDHAQAAFVRALQIARQHHSLRQIAQAAGISYSRVAQLTEQETRT